MTYKTRPTMFVTCDSAAHPGDPTHRIEFGPVFAPNEVLARLGWSYSARQNRHYCPDCAKLERMVTL